MPTSAQRFVILGNQRSRSTLLVQLLDGTSFAALLDEDRVLDRERWLSYEQGDVDEPAALERRLGALEDYAVLGWRLAASASEAPTLASPPSSTSHDWRRRLATRIDPLVGRWRRSGSH